MPPPSAATTAMRANRGQDTKPELLLRRALHSRGHRYRVGQKIELPGRRVRPDLVFRGRKVAVFVDGCFWHQCPEHGRMPSDPTGYWGVKLARNVSRDTDVNADLEQAGWTVVRIWEHTPPDIAADLVQGALQG